MIETLITVLFLIFFGICRIGYVLERIYDKLNEK